MSIDLSKVSPYGMGTMNFTWRPNPIELKTAFDVLNAAIDTNKPQKTFINGGEFYGSDYMNLKYLSDFFTKYPEQRAYAVISIKGSCDNITLYPHTDREFLLKSVDKIIEFIPGLEIFEPARLNPDIPFEETAKALDEVIDSKKIKGFTLSEVSGDTLKKFTKLTKHKIKGVEVEFSLFTREIIENGLAQVAGELNIPIIVYSPLSRGFLTGDIRKKSDIPKGDMRHHFERFTDENIAANIAIVDELKKISEFKGITIAQLALAWIHYHSEKTIDGIKYPTIIPIPSSSSVGRVAENFKKIKLTEKEFNAIQKIIEGKEIKGHRYWESIGFLSI